MLSATPALAQPKGAPPPKGPPAAQPAGAPSPETVKKATDAFKQGTSLFQQKKFALALDQFRTSYATVQSPNSALYVARCLVEMGQTKEAYAQFKKVIAEADARSKTEPKYAPTRDSAKAELDELMAKVASLTIIVSGAPEGSSLRVGGAIVPKESWGTPLPQDPGPVDAVLEVPGKPPVTQRVTLKKGEKQSITLTAPVDQVVTPPPPPPKQEESGPSVMLPLAITFGGIGVIGMGMFGVAGGMSLGTYSELEDGCPSNCPAETIDRGETEQMIANIGLTVGAVGLAAGATFLIVELAGGGGGTTEARAIDIDVGPGYAGIRGAF